MFLFFFWGWKLIWFNLSVFQWVSFKYLLKTIHYVMSQKSLQLNFFGSTLLDFWRKNEFFFEAWNKFWLFMESWSKITVSLFVKSIQSCNSHPRLCMARVQSWATETSSHLTTTIFFYLSLLFQLKSSTCTDWGWWWRWWSDDGILAVDTAVVIDSLFLERRKITCDKRSKRTVEGYTWTSLPNS